MPFYLRVSFAGKKANVKIEGEKVFIGRSSTCQVCLKDPLISNTHGLITLVDDHLIIKDLQSTNGIIINGKKIQESKLYIGDIVKLGKTTLQLISKEMTPEQTFHHTNKNIPIKTQIMDVSLHRDKTDDIDPFDDSGIEKNKNLDNLDVTIDLSDIDDD